MTRLLTRFSVAVLLLKLTVLIINVRTFPRLRHGLPVPTNKRVSILVPARDEVANLQVTLPLLLAQGADEVIVLDDHSRDDTASLAHGMGARVITGSALPKGWHGKNWACQQLAQVASGDILIFTDADVHWHAGALDALLAQFRQTPSDLLSVWPRQQNLTLGERLVTPLLDHLLLCWFPAPLARWPFPDASAANGQVMVFRAETYRRLGGHAAVKNRIVEDMALAHAVKAASGRLQVALGAELLSVRMYRSYPQSVTGIAKITLPFHRQLRPAMVVTWLVHLLVYTVPWLQRQPVPMLLSVLEGLLVRKLAGRRSGADQAEVLLTPILPLLAAPIYGLAWRKNVQWKGRHYPQAGRR